MTVSERTKRLADALLADRNRVEPPSHNIVPCFACGHAFVYKRRRRDLNGRFCSTRCQQWFDDGNPPLADLRPSTLIGWKVIAGGVEVGGDDYAGIFGKQPMRMLGRTLAGFCIQCAGCGREFESRGLRCCSDECERRHVERQKNLAIMAEVGIEPAAKKRCAAPGCANAIPKWRNGRRVSSATRFARRAVHGNPRA